MGDEDHARVESAAARARATRGWRRRGGWSARREAAGRDRRRASARATRASARRPRTCPAAGRGRVREAEPAERPRSRARARRSRPRARAAPAPRSSGGASPGSWSPAAIACSSGASSCSVAIRSPAPESDVFAQGQPPLERRALVVQRDARPLLEGELAAVHLGLAREDAEQRRLAGPVRARERDPVAPLDLERSIAVEQQRAGDLLPEIGADHYGHFKSEFGRSIAAVCPSAKPGFARREPKKALVCKSV